MVHSDVVESTIVGAQKHPLLREVQLERTGYKRATVEPIHHEWIKLRSNRLEVIEVQIATPDGPLSVLPPGCHSRHSSTIKTDKCKRLIHYWNSTCVVDL